MIQPTEPKQPEQPEEPGAVDESLSEQSGYIQTHKLLLGIFDDSRVGNGSEKSREKSRQMCSTQQHNRRMLW